MLRSSKSIPIATITKAARNANGVQNMLVNVVGAPKAENWISGIEFRNSLLANGLNPDLPLPWFVGMRIKCEQITILPEDVADGKVVTIEGRGLDRKTGKPRVINFKTAGVHNLNAELDMNSISVEKFMAMSELSLKFQRPRNTMGAGTAMNQTPAATETIVDDQPEAPETTEQPEQPHADLTT